MKVLSALKLRLLSKEDLVKIILDQGKRIEELEYKLACRDKDSSNSSKPPSTDINKKPNRNSRREKSGKKSGGQNGHKGVTRKQVENPDEIITCQPEVCKNCGKGLQGLIGKIFARRQEVDTPPIEPIYREYQGIEIVCDCGCRNRGAFPGHIRAPMQLGENIKSLVTYLNVVHHLPYERSTQLISDLVDVGISEGTVEKG